MKQTRKFDAYLDCKKKKMNCTAIGLFVEHTIYPGFPQLRYHKQEK